MISERTPGEKLAYADGFKSAIDCFTTRLLDAQDSPQVIDHGKSVHTLMLATLDPPKQPAPNDHWCIGCSPDPDNFTDQPCCGCERPRPTDGP